MAKLTLNILPTLKSWFVEKTNIVKEWSASVSDDNIPSEKLVKSEIDNANTKHTTELADAKTELETKIDAKVNKTAIKSSIESTITDEELIGGKTLYDELKRLEEDIPDNMKHTDITDWDSAVSGFELSSNKATSLSDDDDTHYPTSKAVKSEVDKKINLSDKSSVVDNTSSDSQVPSAKAVYDLYSTIPKWQVKIATSVNDLPATGQLGTIYLVKGTGKDKNNYEEYFWNDATDTPGYEKFGGIDMDISNFITMSDVISYINNNGSLSLSSDGELALNIVDPTA